MRNKKRTAGMPMGVQAGKQEQGQGSRREEAGHMGKTAVLVSGGILEEQFAKEWLEKEREKVLVGIDRGAEFLFHRQVMPDYVVGDLDSMDREIADYYQHAEGVILRRFHPVKDATDTEIAIRLCIELKCDTVYILGATGGRLDHFWGNVQSLAILLQAGVKGVILDSQNHISLLGKGEVCLKRQEAYGPYFSLFPLGEEPVTVDVKGAKYPLTGHRLSAYNSLCVSNTFEEDTVAIRSYGGTAVLMQTRDGKKDGNERGAQ